MEETTMHLLFAQFTMRWMALVTGAAHTTSVLRAMARNAPEPPDDLVAEYELPDQQPPLPAQRIAPTPRPKLV